MLVVVLMNRQDKVICEVLRTNSEDEADACWVEQCDTLGIALDKHKDSFVMTKGITIYPGILEE